mmetsp:Transcript_8912/g.27093  ORF Transcript_8912/g.27093 Transcript_8912/m.27093 type:complete len:418 (-) Transcript_8912:502-1755(-)
MSGCSKEVVSPGFGRRPRLGDAVTLGVEVFDRSHGLQSSAGPVPPPLLSLKGLPYVVGDALPEPALFPTVAAFAAAVCDMQEGEHAALRLPLLAGAPHRGGTASGEARTLEWQVTLLQICVPSGAPLGQFNAASGFELRPRSADLGLSLRALVRQRAQELRESGIAVLRGVDEGALTPGEVDVLREISGNAFSQSLTRINQELGRDSGLVIRFRDCVARRAHRMHVKPPELWDRGACGFLHARGTLHSVLRLAFGAAAFRLTHCGALMAKPATAPMENNMNQAWHRDAPDDPELARLFDPYAVVVYIPLVDMGDRSGVTEFILGSHRAGALDCSRFEREPPPPEQVVSTAGLSAGDVVLFDIRLCHRGLLRTDRERGYGEFCMRPVVAMNFGVDAWEDGEDVHNWGESFLVEGPHGK